MSDFKDIDIFIPCCIDQLYPETGFNVIKVFEKIGVKVNYNPQQICCGQSIFKNGFWDEAKEIGEKFINDFNTDRYVVSPSASCVGYIKTQYWNLFYNTGYHLEYKNLHERIVEFTDYLVNFLHIVDVGATFEHTVTYHDSCSALRECHIREEPRILLSNVHGLTLVEMEKTERCCGFGGAFSLEYPELSVSMTERKLQAALATGAEYIVSTDASCLGNMRAVIDRQKLPIKCIHIADVLASGL
ncbi:MAG: (Fe-S)-binding protein [Bacteroidales bacterium]|jgi:L-lactate dehydrogenase complex protein LldE|nr:(Fe-S)-binding protein [Bacteroidales bacterium]